MVANIEGNFIGDKTPEELSAKLTKIQLGKDKTYDLADFTGKVGVSMFLKWLYLHLL